MLPKYRFKIFWCLPDFKNIFLEYFGPLGFQEGEYKTKTSGKDLRQSEKMWAFLTESYSPEVMQVCPHVSSYCLKSGLHLQSETFSHLISALNPLFISPLKGGPFVPSCGPSCSETTNKCIFELACGFIQTGPVTVIECNI